MQTKKAFTSLIILLFTVQILNSCSKPIPIDGGGIKINKESGPPGWFLNQVHFDVGSNNLYGYGGSRNFDNAKNNAAADLSSFLSVRIASDSKSREYISRGQEIKSNSDFQQIVKTSSEPIILTGAEIAESEKIADYYYVKIFVNAQKLNDYLFSKINQTIENLDYQTAKTAIVPDMEDLKNLSKLSNNIKEANTAFSMLEALNNIKSNHFFSGNLISEKRSEYERLLDTYQDKFSDSFLLILLKDEKLATIGPAISALLSESLVKNTFSDSKTASANNQNATGALIIAGSADNIDFQGAKIANLNLTLSLTNQQNLTLGAKSYQLRGISPTSFEDAQAKAIQNFKQQLAGSNLIVDIFNDL